MQTSIKARLARALVPLALAGTCLACAPVAALASDAPAGLAAGDAVVASASAAPDASAAAEARAQVGAKLADAGVYADGTLVASVTDLALADLPADAAPEQLQAAFAKAAQTAPEGYAVASATAQGTRTPAGVDGGKDATAYLFSVEASGPYEVTQNADGTTSTSKVGPEGHWTLTQAYVALPEGGFVLAQVGVSGNASDETRTAADAAMESLALAPVEDASAAKAGTSASAAADASASAKKGAPLMGFTFEAPSGLKASSDEALWLGASDDVMVEWMGTLVSAADAATLDDAATAAIFEGVAEELDATFEGTQAREAKNATVQVGVLAADGGAAGTLECLLALVPVADGSVEGLLVVCDAQAATTWADALAQMVASIEVTPAADAA